LLLSITGFNLDLHVCQDEVQSFSVFSQAESCTGTCAEPANVHTPDGINKKPCCANEHYFFSPEFQETDGVALQAPLSETQDFATQTNAPVEKSLIELDQGVTRPPPDISADGRSKEAFFQTWLI